MKKIIMLLVLLLLLCCIWSINTYASDITINCTTVSDTEVEADVIITDNPGIAAFTFMLDYDNSKLTPVSVIKGDLLGSRTLYSNYDTPGITAVSAVCISHDDIIGDGILYTIKFEIKDSTYGYSPLSISYDEGDVVAANDQDIMPETEDVVYELPTLSPFNLSITSNPLSVSDGLLRGDISIELEAVGQPEGTYTAWVGVYKDNRCLQSFVQPVLWREDSTQFGYTWDYINIAASGEGNYYIRTFLWDTAKPMEPLTKTSFQQL